MASSVNGGSSNILAPLAFLLKSLRAIKLVRNALGLRRANRLAQAKNKFPTYVSPSLAEHLANAPHARFRALHPPRSSERTRRNYVPTASHVISCVFGIKHIYGYFIAHSSLLILARVAWLPHNRQSGHRATDSMNITVFCQLIKWT